LSLSNEPDKLANTALDTLIQVLEIDCCWIQTINDRNRKKLSLSAERGFSPEMKREITDMEMDDTLSEQIIGLGHKVVVTDLASDGVYGLPSFNEAGYKWMVAVPLMTYRVHGILGTASRSRKALKRDTPDLVMVIAGLIAASLSKAELARQFKGDKTSRATPAEASEIPAQPGVKTPAPSAAEAQKIVAPAAKIKMPEAAPVVEKPFKAPVSEPAGLPAETRQKTTGAMAKETLKTAAPPVKTRPPGDALKVEKPALAQVPAPASLADETRPTLPVDKGTQPDAAPRRKPARPDGPFNSHARKMELFRKTHR
jgi:hypothetical protein